MDKWDSFKTVFTFEKKVSMQGKHLDVFPVKFGREQ